MFQVGVDCEKISRFKRLPYRENEGFYKKIFTTGEIKYCTAFRDPYPRFAVRFAAKEAVIKALNGIARPSFANIEIRKDKTDKPEIHIGEGSHGSIAGLSIALSLTHSDSYAVAFAVITDEKRGMKEKARRAVRKSASGIRKTIGG